MWLKPPEWENHTCPPPEYFPHDFEQYEGAIWRCDLCLKTWILKKSEDTTYMGRHFLVWRPYKIGD